MATRALVQGAKLIQQNGQYVGARRAVMVYVTSGGTEMEIVQAALDDEGVPQTGDSLSVEYPRLCVANRDGEIVGKKRGGPHIVKCQIEYVLEAPDRGYPDRGGAHVSQIQVKKDRHGEYLTYQYGSRLEYKQAFVTAPQQFEVRRTVELTNDPGSLAGQYINKVNSDEWMNSPPGRWLCTKVEYNLINSQTKPDRYDFLWEFYKTADPDGWNPRLWYHTPDGIIPADIFTKGEGFKEVDWYEPVPFSSKFPPLDYDD